MTKTLVCRDVSGPKDDQMHSVRENVRLLGTIYLRYAWVRRSGRRNERRVIRHRVTSFASCGNLVFGDWSRRPVYLLVLRARNISWSGSALGVVIGGVSPSRGAFSRLWTTTPLGKLTIYLQYPTVALFCDCHMKPGDRIMSRKHAKRIAPRQRGGLPVDNTPVPGGRLRTVNCDAAGIDIGATVHFVAVPKGRDEEACTEFALRPIWKVLLIGSRNVVLRLSPWNRLACIGFRCMNCWSIVGLRLSCRSPARSRGARPKK